MPDTRYDWTAVRLGKNYRDDSGATRKGVLCPFCGRRGLMKSEKHRGVLHALTRGRLGPFDTTMDVDQCRDPQWEALHRWKSALEDVVKAMRLQDRNEALELLKARLPPGTWADVVKGLTASPAAVRELPAKPLVVVVDVDVEPTG